MNLLFLSLSAPPQSSPESLQVAKYINGLSQKCNVTLVTIRKIGGWRHPDNDLLQYLSKTKKVIRLPHFNSFLVRNISKVLWSKWLRRYDDYYLVTKIMGIIPFLVGRKPDLLYSRSTPFTSNIIAYNLKKKFKIPWIMHLSDLWADSPIHELSDKDYLFVNSLEEKCMNSADLISLTSEETVAFYQTKYPQFAHKFIFSHNVYSNEELAPNPFQFGAKLKFLHSGNFYGPGRSPENLLKAFSNIQQVDEILLKNVEITFLGKSNPDIQQLIKNSLLPNIKLISNYTFNDSVQHQRSSHILILIDWKFGKMKSIYFLSKLLGYMASQRPILAITEKGSTCYNVIEGKYGRCFEHNDIYGMSEYIREILNNFKIKNSEFFTVQEPDPKYAAQINVDKLHQVMSNLAN